MPSTRGFRLRVAGYALPSAAGIGLLGSIWSSGEALQRPLHMSLALSMGAVLLLMQLLLGGPEA